MKRLILALTATVLLAGTAMAAEHTVEIRGMKFAPANVEVKAGDAVTFINRDGAPHTATARNGAFNTGRLNKDESARVVIKTVGAYAYFCAVHPAMKGRISAR